MTATLKIVFDNTSRGANLKYGWGFAAFVRVGDERVMFDSGAQPDVLANNMKLLDIAPAEVTRVFISHDHWDHVGGLTAILGEAMGVEVHIPSVSRRLESRVKRHGCIPRQVPKLTEAGSEPRLHPIAPAIFSTMEMEASPPEHSMVVDTRDGPLVVTGCSHQGIVETVARVTEATGRPVHTLLGGFHLFRTSNTQIEAITRRLRELGVRRLAATHCTGAKAERIMREQFGDDFLPAGAGAVFELP